MPVAMWSLGESGAGGEAGADDMGGDGRGSSGDEERAEGDGGRRCNIGGERSNGEWDGVKKQRRKPVWGVM